MTRSRLESRTSDQMLLEKCYIRTPGIALRRSTSMKVFVISMNGTDGLGGIKSFYRGSVPQM